MTAALARRLRALELKLGKAARPMTAFVIRAATAADAQAMLARAIESNAVRSGDPVLMLTCIAFAEGEWEDLADISLNDLAALAEGGRPSKEAAMLTDNELHAAIIDGLPRVA